MDMIDIKNESGFQEQISESECPSSFESTMNVSANDGMPDFKSKIISGQIQLREKRGRSRAWNIFATMIDENGDEIENFVACRNCFSSYKFVNSTSNLVKHKCFLQYEAKENQRNPQYVPLSFEIKDKLSDAVVQWLVKNGRSCNILQDSGLKDFVRILLTIGADFGENVNMEDVIPNPATIAVTIKELYEERRQAIIAELGNAKNGYSITTAIWVDNCLKQPLASVTVHYIQQSAMVSRLLAVYPLARDANTGKNIRAFVEKSLRTFDCDLDEDDPIIVISGDKVEGDAIAKALKNKHYIRCIKSLLEDAIEEVFRENVDLYLLRQMCISLVEQCTTSSIFRHLLSESNPKSEQYSTMYYFELLAGNWDVLSEIIVDKSEYATIRNEIKAVSNILVSFTQTLEALKEHNKPTLHTIIPHLHKLNKLCAYNVEDKPKINLLKSSLRTCLESIVKNHITKFHKIALFLFPPAKKLLLYNEAERKDIISECKAMMEELCIEPDNDKKRIKLDDEYRDLGIFSDFVEQTSSTDTKADVINNEINEYLNRNFAHCKILCILDWWRSNKGVFPLLYQVSCKVLTTPSTIALSQRALLQAQGLLSDQPSSIDYPEDVVNETIFLNINMDNII